MATNRSDSFLLPSGSTLERNLRAGSPSKPPSAGFRIPQTACPPKVRDVAVGAMQRGEHMAIPVHARIHSPQHKLSPRYGKPSVRILWPKLLKAQVAAFQQQCKCRGLHVETHTGCGCVLWLVAHVSASVLRPTLAVEMSFGSLLMLVCH
jgi:hypothetical protein